VLQFVCECDAVKDTGKEEYLRPFIHIGLDCMDCHCSHHCGRILTASTLKLVFSIL